MNVRDQIAAAQQVIADRGIDLEAAKLAYKSMHPQLEADRIELALTMEVSIISTLHPPFTVDSVAKQIADTSGAFPWDGPVGNGFTRDEYRDRFRDMAREKIFLAKQLGMDGAGE